MSCVWAWDWGVDFPTQSYADDPLWDVSDAPRVDTQSTTGLVSPTSPDTPGEVRVCSLNDSAAKITTPPFPGGPYAQGWYWARWRHTPTLALRSGFPLLELFEGGAVAVEVEVVNSANPSPVNLNVNGVLVGTTAVAIGDAASYVLAIQFDFTASPPQAGLWIDGVNQVPLTAGGGGPGAIDSARLSSGTTAFSGESLWGLQLMFDDLADPGDNPDFWAGDPNTNLVTDPDASWSIVGGAPTQTAALSDKNISTGVETSTDPDTLDIAYEATTDILPTWTPTNIIHVAAAVIASGEVINNATLTLDDGVGVVGSESVLTTSVPRIISFHAPLASGGAAWDVARVDACVTTYDVT